MLCQSVEMITCQVLNPSAPPAEQVVMRLTGNFVHRVPLNLSRKDQPQPTEKIQRAVNGSPIDDRRFGPYPLVNLLECSMALPFTNSIQNQLALRGYPESLLSHTGRIVQTLV